MRLAAATAAIEKVNQDIKSAGESVTSQWNALKTKVAADMDAWNAKVAQLKHEKQSRPRNMPSGWSGRHLSQSTMPRRQSRRQSRLFSMLSSPASRLKKPRPLNSAAFDPASGKTVRTIDVAGHKGHGTAGKIARSVARFRCLLAPVRGSAAGVVTSDVGISVGICLRQPWSHADA